MGHCAPERLKLAWLLFFFFRNTGLKDHGGHILSLQKKKQTIKYKKKKKTF